MVKVQQARVKMKMDRFDRARDRRTPVATAKDVPDGTKGGSGSETQAKRLKEEITTLEKGVKELRATADKLGQGFDRLAEEAPDIFEELKKYRPMEQIRADQGGPGGRDHEPVHRAQPVPQGTAGAGEADRRDRQDPQEAGILCRIT